MTKEIAILRKKALVRIGALVASFAFVAGSSAFATSHLAWVNEFESTQAAKIDALSKELADVRANQTTTAGKLSQTVRGLDHVRKNKDDKDITELLRVAATWSTGEDYIKARDALINGVWDLDPNSQFLKVFLPGEEEGAYRVDGAGKKHFAYEGVRNDLAGVDSVVIGIDGLIYSYFAEVKMTTTGADGKTTNTTVTPMTYTVDANGKIGNLSAWAQAPGLMRNY